MKFRAIIFLLFLTTALSTFAVEEKPAIEKTKEQKLGEFLEKAAEEETKRRMDKIGTRIDEMAALCELTPEQTKKLKLASKGAVESSLDDWREWIQSYANSRLQRAGENVEAALAQIAGVRYGGDQISHILKSDVWQRTLEESLSDEQRTILAEAEAERLKFRHKSITAYLVANLDFNLRLSPDQRNEIGPLVFASVEKYVEKLITSSGGDFPQYQAISLLGGVDEEAAKKVLTEAQWDAWMNLFKEHGGWWDGINR